MIRVSTFKPEHFNNNGDQGNIEVLSFCLSAQGIEYVVTDQIEPADDFVLVGDASIAAMNHYESDLLELVPLLAKRLEAGKATLLVGRAYEFLAPHLGLDLQVGARRSEFLKVSSDLGDIMGYHNSEVVEPRFFVSGNFFGTTLFGPVLAKNPGLLVQILNSLGYQGELDQWQLEIPAEIATRTIFG